MAILALPKESTKPNALESLCSNRETLHASTTSGSSVPSQAISRQDC